jgi:rRNA maturation RNase YbeY
LSVRIFYDKINFRLKNWRNIKKLIEKVITEEGSVSGDLNFIITDDDSLLDINREFLKHNYYTDVISFSNGVKGEVSGEIYISLDRVRENADNYKISLSREILRVVIHGTLHLCGYVDQAPFDKAKMRSREDYWLSIYNEV